jgi:DNA-binding SARP family transcriptional activator
MSTRRQEAGLKLLGGFRLYAPSGDTLTLNLRKSEALLAYLACQPSCSASREQIANLLWGDYAQPRARQSLRQALLDIKKVFARAGLEPLRIGRELIALDEDLVTSDVLAFEALVEEGSAQSLGEALALFHGDFLAGLNIRSSDFDGWLWAHRNRFQDLYVRAASDYMDLVGQSDPEAAIAVGKRALEQDPTREELHRALIDLYGRRGLQSAAMAQYRQCAAVLERELGIGPDEETVRLAERITRQDRQPPQPEPAREVSPPMGARVAEPAADTSVPVAIGRASELSLLEREIENLSQGLGRVVVLRGENGIGKRHLCLCLMAGRVQGAVQISVPDHGPGTTFPWSDLIAQILKKASDIFDEGLDTEGAAALALLRGARSADTPAQAIAVDDHGVTTEARTAAAALVRILSRRVTMVLAFDGLHRLVGTDLDEAFLWIRRIANYPVLVLVCAPPAAVSRAPRFEEQLSQILDQGHCRLLDLSPLSDEATDELGRELLTRLGLQPVRAAPLAWIGRISQGNPRVAIALAMDLHGRKGQIPETESYLPAEIEAEIMAEVSRLSPPARDIVALLALQGESAGLTLLAHASELAAGDLAAAVDELISLGVVEVDEEVARIRHRRVRYALVNTLSSPRRRALHAALARACEGLDQRDRILQSTHTARHLLASGEAGRAAAYQLMAADLAYRRAALDEAKDFLEAVVGIEARSDMSSSSPLLTIALRGRLGLVRIAEWRGDFNRALEGAGAVAQRAEGPELRDIKGRAEVCRARALFALGDPGSALRAARRAERLAEGWDGGGAWLSPDLFLARRHLCRHHAVGLSAAIQRAHQDGLDEGLVLDVFETRGTLAVLSLDQSPTDALTQLDAARVEAEGLANARVDALLDHLSGLAALAGGDRSGGASFLERACLAAERAGDLYRHYIVEGERALLADDRHRDPDVLMERVALLESTLGSQRMTIALAARRASQDRDHDGRSLLSGAMHAAMRLNDHEGFGAVRDEAGASNR